MCLIQKAVIHSVVLFTETDESGIAMHNVSKSKLIPADSDSLIHSFSISYNFSASKFGRFKFYNALLNSFSSFYSHCHHFSCRNLVPFCIWFIHPSCFPVSIQLTCVFFFPETPIWLFFFSLDTYNAFPMSVESNRKHSTQNLPQFAQSNHGNLNFHFSPNCSLKYSSRSVLFTCPELPCLQTLVLAVLSA